MKFLENIKIALDSIKSNKMRSFLTMLGIIIGISSVITIVSLGQGGQSTITGEFEKIGACTVTVSVDSSKADKNDYITTKDVEKIRESVENVKYITAVVSKSGEVVSEKKSKRAVITGGNTDMTYINGDEIIYGRYFNEKEDVEGRAVAVIDQSTAKSLFGEVDVTGKTFKVGSKASPKKVTIVGVTKGYVGPFSDNQNENMPAYIYVPMNFLKKIYSYDFIVDKMYIVSSSKENTEITGNSAINILESRHNNRGKNIYKPQSVMKQLEQVNKVLGIFTAFIGAVAAISLLVGGIGVMNIMLVSVTERTREIGIRKAIGATTRTILMQFLTESVILTLIGGIIGIILGIIGAQLIGMIAGITPSISIVVIIGTILFSSAVGIFFGIYPARKAAKLDPIDALRYE